MNSHDCGVYAVAIATELAFKNDPTPKDEATSSSLFSGWKMSRFPTLGKRRITFGSRARKSYLE